MEGKRAVCGQKNGAGMASLQHTIGEVNTEHESMFTWPVA